MLGATHAVFPHARKGAEAPRKLLRKRVSHNTGRRKAAEAPRKLLRKLSLEHRQAEGRGRVAEVTPEAKSRHLVRPAAEEGLARQQTQSTVEGVCLRRHRRPGRGKKSFFPRKDAEGRRKHRGSVTIFSWATPARPPAALGVWGGQCCCAAGVRAGVPWADWSLFRACAGQGRCLAVIGTGCGRLHKRNKGCAACALALQLRLVTRGSNKLSDKLVTWGGNKGLVSSSRASSKLSNNAR